jgi:putative DNA-invertase from lambdoid prophage Rac
MTNTGKRAALYLRVSTGMQETENQRPDILQVVRTRGLEIVQIFDEKMSAAKERPEFKKMLLAAHRGSFDCLVIWSLDRFGRSMVGNLQAVIELDRIGVQVISVREQWLDTSGPVRSLLIAIFSWVAEQERLRISERTKAGLERARRQGKQIGRPKATINMPVALALRDRGLSIRQMARELKIGASTLHRLLAAADTLQTATFQAVPDGSPVPIVQPCEIKQAA